MKILIVDDHILFREGLVSILDNNNGFRVVGQASTVSETVEKTLELDPDLVLMDISLPDGSGIDAMQAILAQKPKIKIVFLSPYNSDDALLDSIRNGAVGYISKNSPAAKIILSLKGIERGEVALSRRMTSKLLNEFQRIGKLYKPYNTKELDNLSERELQVLYLLGEKASNQEIADRLCIAVNTVKVHIHNIYNKLGFKNRREAGDFSRRNNLGSNHDYI